MTTHLPVSCIGSIYAKSDPAELRLSVSSLFSSHIHPCEVILVVDGPIDTNLLNEVHSLSTTYGLKPLHSPRNRGLGPSLNLALSAASYEFIVRFDTDDFNHPSRLINQYQFLVDNPTIACCGSNVLEFYERSDTIFFRTKSVPITNRSIRLHSLFRNPLNHPTTVYRKHFVDKLGGYRNIPFFEDYDLWLRMINSGYSFFNLCDVLVFMRRESQSLRRTGLPYFFSYLKFIMTSFRFANFPLVFLMIHFLRALMILVLPVNLLPDAPWRSTWKSLSIPITSLHDYI